MLGLNPCHLVDPVFQFLNPSVQGSYSDLQLIHSGIEIPSPLRLCVHTLESSFQVRLPFVQHADALLHGAGLLG